MSERSREVTASVSEWVINDGDYYEHARMLRHAPDVLGGWLTLALKMAKRGSAAWYVAQDLAPADYERIDWASIAQDLD